MADTPYPLYFEKASLWREWLQKNHSNATEAWVVFYKKGSKTPGMSPREATDEALNFGWIDTKIESIDGEKYMLRYVPRRPGSHWTKGNIERAEELVRAGRMGEAGLAAIEEAKRNGNWDKA